MVASFPPFTSRVIPPPFTDLGGRLWLDFVNTDDVRQGVRVDLLRDLESLVLFLEGRGGLEAERAQGLRRRALQQPAGATAALVEARRIRAAMRGLAERGATSAQVREDARGEINRVLGRSAGMRRVEAREDGTLAHQFIPVGDAFAALVMPIVESAAESLVAGDLARVRRCADPRCPRVFLDATRNGRRRWCEMRTCGNRAKAARFRIRP